MKPDYVPEGRGREAGGADEVDGARMGTVLAVASVGISVGITD
jgi:hypothetical protein